MTTAIDQLHDTREAGRLLGGLHPRDVLRLIHAGHLKAKPQTIRGGKGKTLRPRLYVPASAIAEYIEKLPYAEKSRPDDPPAPKRRTTAPRGVRAELANVKAYY